MFILGFPLLLIPFAIYNIIAFLMPTVGWTGVVTTVHMVSGVEWTMSAGDLLLVLAIFLLVLEIMKSTRIGIRTVVDHALSLLLFLAMIVEFILVPQTATATFFLLLVISLRRRARRLRRDPAFGAARPHGRRRAARPVLIVSSNREFP